MNRDEVYMNVEAIHRYFINLGFSNRESRILSFLLKYGPLTVGELYRYTGIAKPHIYDILGKLVSMGVVLKIDERPSRYNITDDKHVFTKIAESMKNRIDLSLKEIEKVLAKTTGQGTMIIDNPRLFKKMFFREIGKVDRRCFLMTPKVSLIKNILNKVSEMYERGIEIRLATSDLEYIRSLAIQPSYVRYFEPKQPFLFCLLDDKLFLEIICNRFIIGIISNEKSVVKIFEKYFEHVWSDDYIRALYKLRMTLKREY